MTAPSLGIAGGDWHRQADLLAEAHRMATT